MFSTRAVRSIQGVSRIEWDDMAGDNAFASYGWLRTVEQTHRRLGDPQYLLLEENGKLAGAGIYYFLDRSLDGRGLDHELFGRVRKAAGNVGLSFHPVLVCGPTRSFGRHFLIESSSNEERAISITEALLNGMEKEAAKTKAALAFTQVMDTEAGLKRMLSEKRFAKTVSAPVNYLDIRWGTFEEYRENIKKISRNMEANIRKEINRNQREGVRISFLSNLEPHEDRLNELINGNYYKHNGAPFPYAPDFFRRLKENMGNDAVIYAAFKKEELVGFSILLKKQDCYYLPFVGVDHALSGNDATYFNITIYKPIMDGTAAGVRRIYMGTAMYELKKRRGCETLNAYTYYKSYNRIKDLAARSWFTIHSKWSKRKQSKHVGPRKQPAQ
jgi:predicted N-acyltransferase